MVIDPYMPDHPQKAMSALESFTRQSGSPANIWVGVGTEYMLQDLAADVDKMSLTELLERYDIPESTIQASPPARDPQAQVFDILSASHPARARDLAAKLGGQVVDLPQGAAFLAPSGELDTFMHLPRLSENPEPHSPISLREIDPTADSYAIQAAPADRKAIAALRMSTEALQVETLEPGAEPVELRSLPSGVAITLCAPGFLAIRFAKPDSDMQEIACASAQEFIDRTRKPGFQMDLVYDLAAISQALREATGVGRAATGISDGPIRREPIVPDPVNPMDSASGDDYTRSIREAQEIILTSTLKRYATIFRDHAAAAGVRATDLTGKEIVFTADGRREIRARVD